MGVKLKARVVLKSDPQGWAGNNKGPAGVAAKTCPIFSLDSALQHSAGQNGA